MWELDHKESWVLKNWCFWTVVFEKTLESPLDCKGSQPVHHKGNQSWIFIGRTDAEAEAPILWSPDVKNWLIWKDPDAGKDWRQEEKGMAEDEMVGWHYQLINMSLSRFQKLVLDRETWCATVHGITKNWTWLSNWTELNWWEQLIHWKSPWCWERLRAEGEEGIRGWDGWMASPMQCTWTWADFRRWWGTETPGVLSSVGLQKVEQGWATEHNSVF